MHYCYDSCNVAANRHNYGFIFCVGPHLAAEIVQVSTIRLVSG
jgi:hypothetical protein